MGGGGSKNGSKTRKGEANLGATQVRGQPSLQYRAKFSYSTMHPTDLSFDEGDVLTVESNGLAQDSDPNWKQAKNVRTNRTGFVPTNFIEEVQGNNPRNLAGFFDISRDEAESELMRAVYKHGDYILRRSSSGNSNLAITVKFLVDGVFRINNYQIICKKNQYHISTSCVFPSVEALLLYYSIDNRGLVGALMRPVDPRKRPQLPFRDLVISESSVTVGENIGSGSFGVVHRAKLLHKTDVAIKKLKIKDTMGTKEGLEEEARMHSELQHENVLLLIGFVRPKNGDIWIVMELAEFGSLRRQLSKSLTLGVKIDYIQQIACGMRYLESLNVVHRDLRAANMLMTSSYQIKIADFGLARVLEKYEEEYTVEAAIYHGGPNCKFPIRWTAPEGLEHHEFSVKSDVWSFGVCIYEVLSNGRRPFVGMNNKEVIELISRGERLANPMLGAFPEDPRRQSMVDLIYNRVMLRCWCHDPRNRPSFADIYDQLCNLDSRVGKLTEVKVF